MTDKQFDYAYRQHVTKFEGEEELSAAFNNFLVQDNDDNNDFNLLKKAEIEFITFNRDAPTRTFKNLIIKLCNCSFLHHITKQGPGSTNKDIVNTFTNKLTLRYNSN